MHSAEVTSPWSNRPRLPVAGIAATIDLEFRPVDRAVHHVRVMSHSFASLHGHDPGAAARLTVTCAELVDALARRYFPEACQLRIRVDGLTRRPRIELSGRASPADARLLESAVQAANRGTPADAYTYALSLAGGSEDGMLGLARIRYEGQMRVELQRLGARLVLCAETID